MRRRVPQARNRDVPASKKCPPQGRKGAAARRHITKEVVAPRSEASKLAKTAAGPALIDCVIYLDTMLQRQII